MKKQELRRRLTTLHADADEVRDAIKRACHAAERERRDLRPDEHKEVGKHETRLDSITKEIRDLETDVLCGDEPRLERSMFATVPDSDRGLARSPVLTSEQRIADWARERNVRSSEFTPADADSFCIGSIMRALVDPSFRDELSDVERRALMEGTDSAGGFITPEPLAGNLIDKVRNQAQVIRAGASTVPLESDKQSIPRLTGDPSGSWRNEGDTFGSSDATFDRVTFTARSFGFIVKTSEELYQDAVPGAVRTIENSIVQTAALELDRVALRGSGTAPEPKGILNQSGVTLSSLAAGGLNPTYANVMSAITTLRNANREPSDVLLAPRTDQSLAGLTDTTGQPLRAPTPVAALQPFKATNQIPTNLDSSNAANHDCSEIYVADWRDLYIGIRLGIQLRLLTERFADTGQYAWRVHLRADIQLAHPASFVVLTGVRP